ncbi:MAG: cation-translocating P-type ATPase [Nitrospirota bacterium]|nr:cation-translocating P-type ATPase [Nitrospirota bacterium]
MRVTANGDDSFARPFPDSDTPWHLHPPQKVLELLSVEPDLGLPTEEAKSRLKIFGPNRIRESPSRSPFLMFLDQFRDITVGVLFAAALIAGWTGEPQDIIAILAIILINAIIGFVQEMRAERSMSALRSLAVPRALVRRDGTFRTVPSVDIVPGDIVRIEAGNRVPADLRLIDVTRLKVDESALTGESVTVDKSSRVLSDSGLFLGDRFNMAYSGTLITNGHATGVAVATGMETEFGRIAALLQNAEEIQSPLEKRLSRFGKRLAMGIVVLCIVFFFAGIARNEKPLPMLLVAVSLAVAAIPEALPAVIRVTLSLGAREMVRKNVLVRRLSSVESLGSVTTICSDKTGTLTQNRMTAGRYFIAEDSEEARSLFFQASCLNNDAFRTPEGVIRGDPTEVALLLLAEEKGFQRESTEAVWPRRDELPFSAERGMMTTVHERDGVPLLFTKGAPERILDVCAFLSQDGPEPVRDRLERQASQMAEEGLRVLAFAYSRDSGTIASVLSSSRENSLTFLGFAGLSDPIRPEALTAVAACRSAGIRVVMLTGDHPATARAVASQLGILDASEESLTGQELEGLRQEEYEKKVRDIRVYSRLNPSQKVKIVKAFQNLNEVVAMTGDGINDAPALRSADIGIAMGLTGTDVAREAAHMVLLDDNFASIVLAVREGRRIFDNIRKFIKYVLTGNSGEIWTLLLAPFFGLPLPLLPIQILWVNLVTDGLPGIALAVEPEENNLMKRPPCPMNEEILSGGLGWHILFVGFLIGGVTLLAQFLALRTGSTHWRTMTFTVLTFAQMAQLLGIRVEGRSVIGRTFFTNPWLVGAVAITVVLQMAVLYMPSLNRLFETQPLTARELSVSVGLSLIVFAAVEIGKWVSRTQSSRRKEGLSEPTDFPEK